VAEQPNRCATGQASRRTGQIEMRAEQTVEHQEDECDGDDGDAVMMMNWVTSVIHVNTGSRIIVIPGAAGSGWMTMKLNPAASDETPRICRPSCQKSIFGPGEKLPLR